MIKLSFVRNNYIRQTVETNQKPSFFITLVGPMGSGKTTIGRALARLLDYQFVDSDQEVQQRSGVSIATIFEIEGEPGFRKRETQAIKDILSSSQPSILATGGGAILSEENRQILQEKSYIIYLQVGIDTLWRRLQYDRHRPLLKTDNPYEQMKKLYTEREPIYLNIANACYKISNHPESVQQTAQHLHQWLLGKQHPHIVKLKQTP